MYILVFNLFFIYLNEIKIISSINSSRSSSSGGSSNNNNNCDGSSISEVKYYW